VGREYLSAISILRSPAHQTSLCRVALPHATREQQNREYYAQTVQDMIRVPRCRLSEVLCCPIAYTLCKMLAGSCIRLQPPMSPSKLRYTSRPYQLPQRSFASSWQNSALDSFGAAYEFRYRTSPDPREPIFNSSRRH